MCVVFALKWLLISCALFFFVIQLQIVTHEVAGLYAVAFLQIWCSQYPFVSLEVTGSPIPPSPVLKRKRITILVSMCQNYKVYFCMSVAKPRPPTSSHRNVLPDLVLVREEECRAYDKGPSARHFNECFKFLHSFRIISGRAFFLNKLTLFFIYKIKLYCSLCLYVWTF